jgi:hypothetical protein
VSIRPGKLTVLAQTPARNAAFEQELANDGGEPLVPLGVAVILDRRGRAVGRSAFERRRLLPGERATFRTVYPAELPPGEYRVLATFEFEARVLTATAGLLVP